MELHFFSISSKTREIPHFGFFALLRNVLGGHLQKETRKLIENPGEILKYCRYKKWKL